MPPTEDRLRELFLRLADGDETAMHALFEAERCKLSRLFSGLSRRRSEVDDLVQSTFLALWRFRANYRGRGSARAYLYRIAMNQWHQSWARERRLRDTEERACDAWDEACSVDPARDLELEELRERVWAAIGTLPDPQREVFLLHRFGGLSCPQVAEATRTNLKTVESRLRLALLRLTQRLQVQEGLL